MSNPKLALIPSGYKSGKVYSILPNDATGDFDFERQSIGTRVRKDGLLEEAKTVGSITNLQPRSEEFDNSVWTKSRTTITANQELAPNGTNTADKFTGTGTGSSYIYDGISFTGGKKYTISIFVKPINVTTFVINKFAGGTGTATFNLSTVTVSAPTGTMSNPIIESLSNGWFRCSAEHTPTSTGVQNYGFGLQNYNGDQYYIWGAMVSEGALSDYIKTEGTTETKTVETFTDVPRLDWLNSNCPSLLLEPQRTNGFTYSEQFNQSAWFKSNCTITTNQIIAPDGTLTADLATSTASGGGIYKFGIWNTTQKTGSIFVKMSNSRRIEIFNSSSSSNRVVYDLGNGTVEIEGGSMTGTIEDFGNGWYRLTATHTAAASQTFGIKPEPNESVYIWGAQIEDGRYASSYIKTEASTVTRLKDECINGGDSDLFDITQGTLFADITPYINKNANHYISLNDGSSSDRFVFIFQSNGIQVRLFGVSATVNIISHYQNITFNQRNKLAVTFKEDGFSFYVNGSRVHTDTSGSMPTGLNQLDFSEYNGNRNFEGKIHDTRVYDRILTEEEAEELTTL